VKEAALQQVAVFEIAKIQKNKRIPASGQRTEFFAHYGFAPFRCEGLISEIAICFFL
jgi:hypothetical protein